MKKFALILALALAEAAFAAAQSVSIQLPNDCAIVATLANATLAKAGIWSRVLFLKSLNPGEPEKAGPSGHAMVVWQPVDGGHILIYDATGTVELPTNSREIKDIVREIQELIPTRPITEAHFLE